MYEYESNQGDGWEDYEGGRYSTQGSLFAHDVRQLLDASLRSMSMMESDDDIVSEHNLCHVIVV